MRTILIFIHIAASLGLIGLVLLQHGRGADAGAAFGSGASQTLFGARGSSSFLTRATALLAAIFFTTSLTLAYLSGQTQQRRSVTDLVSPASSAPAIPSKEESTDLPTSQTLTPPPAKVSEPSTSVTPENVSTHVESTPVKKSESSEPIPTEIPAKTETTESIQSTLSTPTPPSESTPVPMEPIPTKEPETEVSIKVPEAPVSVEPAENISVPMDSNPAEKPTSESSTPAQ